jgi:hypothetical protein
LYSLVTTPSVGLQTSNEGWAHISGDARISVAEESGAQPNGRDGGGAPLAEQRQGAITRRKNQGDFASAKLARRSSRATRTRLNSSTARSGGWGAWKIFDYNLTPVTNYAGDETSACITTGEAQ